MATEKRLIDTTPIIDECKECSAIEWNKSVYTTWAEAEEDFMQRLLDAPTVDAVPVDDIILHHILIDNEGVPEVKLQIGDRYFILHTDPVDVREVVHGRWVFGTANHREYMKCSECLHSYTPDGTFCYCPNCGADMRERRTDY